MVSFKIYSSQFYVCFYVFVFPTFIFLYMIIITKYRLFLNKLFAEKCFDCFCAFEIQISTRNYHC